jgi:hypothetical protein
MSVQLILVNPPTATLLGALVGATAAILAAVITSWWLLRIEQIRTEKTREDVVSTELAGAVQELAIKMSTALHSMCWLTWLTRTDPDRVTQARLDLFDSEQHKTLPEIGGYSTTVAALDKDVYKKIHQVVTDIYELDAFIGRAGLRLHEDRDEMLRRLVRADAAMVALEMQLPEILGDVVSNRVTNPRVPDEVRKITRDPKSDVHPQ